MAKGKKDGVPNRHLYTRVSYLHQAASYLATVQSPTSDSKLDDSERLNRSTHAALARRLVSDIRAVSLKAQIRPSPAIKQIMCKYCDSLLIEGKTCLSIVENPSKGGRKPWADIMVTKCTTCGNVKRFPVGAPRQKRRPFREPETVEGEETSAAVSDQPMEDAPSVVVSDQPMEND